MKRALVVSVLFAMAAAIASAQESAADNNFRTGDFKTGIEWPVPAIVTPGETPINPPSDAIVLFDGTNLDAWEGGPWNVKDGVLTVEPGTGEIKTKQKFGSVQLHIEFSTPAVELGEDGKPLHFSQARGNSGIFFQEHYEVQVLDNFDNPTYPDGQCGGIYKQWAPMVNICKKPGEWQYYDIIYNRPVLKIENEQVVEVIRPAYITVMQNGAVVVNHWEIKGDTFWHRSPCYQPHEDTGSIKLQDHGNRMQFRNIWVREIPDSNIVPPQTLIQHYE